MKNVLLAGTAAIAVLIATGTAHAADITPEPMIDWSGFYIGAHAGYGVADMSGCYDCDVDDSDSELFASDLSLGGLIGGVHAGVNFQMDNIVAGIEGDVTFTDLTDSGLQPSEDSTEQKGDIDLLASVRARLGIVLDDVLVFATAGIALPEAEWTLVNTDGGVEFDEIGGVFGGGVEFAGTEHIRWRAEALYYFFDDSQGIGDLESATAGEAIELDDALVIRGGVSFYLNM